MKKISFFAIVIALALLAPLFVVPTSAASAPATNIAGHNLAMEETVELVYYVEETSNKSAETGVLCWLEPQSNYTYGSEDYKVTEAYGTVTNPKTGKLCKKYALDTLSDQMMSEDIYAVSYVKQGSTITYSDVDKYGILYYAHNKKESETIFDGKQLNTLMTETLGKGAAAQQSTGYKLDRLADDDYVQINLEKGVLSDGIDFGLYPVGAKVAMKANSAPSGKTFSHWVNSVGQSVATTVLAPETDENYTAIFGAFSTGLSFSTNHDGTCDVAGIGSCTDSHVIIPAVAPNGDQVVGIGAGAFDGCEALTGVTIPEGVLSIGERAFQNCTELEVAVLPDGVVSIEMYAFFNCSELGDIALPETIVTIGDKAFSECPNLEIIFMPEGIEIGIDVFRGSIRIYIFMEHDLEFVEAKEATCTEPGNIEYYVCTSCGRYYADSKGRNRLYNVSIPGAHNFVGGVCTKCGMIQDSVLIVAIDEIPDLGKFALGTMENAIGLPEQITVTTRDGMQHELGILWDLSDYDKSTVGTYTIHGHIQAAAYYFDEGLSAEVETSIEIVDFMVGTADIVFVLDISGSMGDDVDNVKENIIAFAQAIEDQGVSARWSAITFSDFTVDGPNEITTIIKNGASDWFTSAEEYRNAIAEIVLAYGGDEPETDIDGLMMANTMTTRQDVRTFYILLTDAHYKIDNHYDVSSMNEAAQILNENRVHVSVITEPELYSNYSVLTTTTGGILSNIRNNFSQDLLDNLVPVIFEAVIE